MNLLPAGLVAAFLLPLCGPATAASPSDPVTDPVTDPVAETEAWRQQRYAALRQPDGYLSLSGSGLVREGESRVGAAADNDIVLPLGPAHLGRLSLDAEGRARFQVEPDSPARVEGARFRQIELKTQLDAGGPTRIQLGEATFYLVRTGALTGWRLRDPNARLRLDFDGIPHYPVDPSWRIQARWEPFDPPRTLEMLTVLGTPESGTVSGQAVFERDGQRHVLLPTDAGDGRLFFVFADRTSGKHTYGGGRFLYAEPARDGQVLLDFNRAYNPPCALNGHVVCPTAPPENRLRLSVEAGEQTPPKP